LLLELLLLPLFAPELLEPLEPELPLELPELDPVPPELELLFVLLEDEEEPDCNDPLPLAEPLPPTEPLPELELPEDEGLLGDVDGEFWLLLLPDEPLPDEPLLPVESVPPIPPGLLQPANRAANARNNSCFFIR
jgi:hypothetical protein